MADNNRIKVAGYSKAVTYEGGIQYRNFSDSLVGNQFTSDGGTTLFTAANFRITTNLDPKVNKIFNTNDFGDFVSLDDLRMTHEEAVAVLDTNTKVKLNFDKSDLDNYAYFGSLREFIRVSLESIIMNWPAALFVTPTNEFNPFYNGPTYQNYSIDNLNGTSTFIVNSTKFVNKFNINYTQNGQILNSFSDTNDLRNMSVNYGSYTVKTSLDEYPIIGFTGITENNPNVYLKVDGFPFSNSATTATTTTYHIKPNEFKVESFFNNLNTFEANLLNRLTLPLYTSNYKYSVETEQGNIIDTEMSISWPISDGYNLDFDSERYIDFVDNLLTIADNNDGINTNLISRFFVSESIHDFDTSDQRVGNTLKIYGREFDEVKKYIDGISNANVVSYDGVRNTPDGVIKNLAKVLGWDLISSITEVDLLNNYILSNNSTFDGHQRGLTPIEAEVEMLRRIILNTPWLWKSKGTRKAVEFLFKFIGSPDGLIDFNEFIYVAKNNLDIELFKEILVANGYTTELTSINIDAEGYPKVLPNTSDMYFQKGGLWYRETGGVNSNVDILIGNNPHFGPYDAGQEYIDQFSCLIPDFEPVTIIQQKIFSGNTNLFMNYDNGEFDGIIDDDIPLYIDVVNQDNLNISDCVIVTSEIINTFPEMFEFDECGCPINNIEKGSLRINIKRNNSQTVDCGYSGFSLDNSGFVLFNLYNGDETFFMNSECCIALGFTPELQDRIYVCRWQQIDVNCDNYTPTTIVDNYQLFIGPDGESTNEVPTRDCCPVRTIPELAPSGNYYCKLENVVISGKCDTYTPSYVNNNNYVVFTLSGGGTTTIIDAECCTQFGYSHLTTNGETHCVITCPQYVSSTVGNDGYIIFVDASNTTYTQVPSPRCCPNNSLAVPLFNDDGGITTYGCRFNVTNPTTFPKSLYRNISSSIGCAISGSNNVNKFIDAANFINASNLYDNALGTILSPAGYYNDTINNRYWSGTAFTIELNC